ncbi:hypothetical protein [Microcoleus sp.]
MVRYALCPMPYALCPMPHVTEKGYKLKVAILLSSSIEKIMQCELCD